MLTIIFLLLMIVVFGKLIWFAGLMVVALPILIIVGLAALFIPKQG